MVIMGVYTIGAGAMTVGALTACTMLVGRAMAPIGQLVALWFKMEHLKDSSAPVETLMRLPPEAGGDTSRAPVARARARLFVQGRVLRLPRRAAPGADRVTLSIRPGEKIGVIGRTGSGKSTFLRLFPRFYDPSAGRIQIDGHDSAQHDPSTCAAPSGSCARSRCCSTTP